MEHRIPKVTCVGDFVSFFFFFFKSKQLYFLRKQQIRPESQEVVAVALKNSFVDWWSCNILEIIVDWESGVICSVFVLQVPVKWLWTNNNVIYPYFTTFRLNDVVNVIFCAI